jgi:hypothetical protein
MFQTQFVEKIKTRVLCLKTFLSENRAVCKEVWKNIVEPGRPQMTMRRMRVACWILKTTNTQDI